MTRRRRLIQAAIGLAGTTLAGVRATAQAPAVPARKVLRYAMRIAETGFDPAQISDLYSNTLAASMFDALYEYEFLARPVRIRPRTAAGMPEASADFKTFIVRVRPGIYFTDDPAFKGQRRELVAQDYVYAIKRMFDPATRSPSFSSLALERRVVAEIDARPHPHDEGLEIGRRLGHAGRGARADAHRAGQEFVFVQRR